MAIGTTIAGYRVEGLLGHGGMGTVYRATQLSLGRTVALKILDARLSADPGFQERFRREARMQAALSHGHIVTVHEAGELDGGLFIAMALISGPNLKEMLGAGELEPQRALRILAPVADALDAAHEAGLVHRDVKPQNILVGPRDHPYLADFGITKDMSETGMTRTGQVLGTLHYMAPEVLRGERATPASDVYSFAAVTYEALTGEVPFPADSEGALVYAHIAEPPPRASEHVGGLPDEVDAIIARGMAKLPGERHERATELAEDLRDVLPSAPRRRRAGGAAAADGARPAADLPAAENDDPGHATERLGYPPSGPALRREPEAPAAAKPAGDRTELEGPRGTPTVADRHRDPDAAAPHSAAPAPAKLERPAAPAAPEPAAPAQPRRDSERPAAAVAPVPAAPPQGKRKRARPAARAPAGPGPLAQRRRRVGLTAAAGVAVAAVAAVTGVAVGGSGERSGAAADSVRVAGADLAVRVPADWRRTSPPQVPGLTFSGTPVALRSPGDGGVVVAGTVDGRGRTLLPPDLLGRVDGAPAGRPVRLGRLQAYRYLDLRPRGAAEPLTSLYATPTTDRVAVLVCLGLPASGCAPIAASLTLAGGVRAVALGPRPAYGKVVNAVIGPLERERALALRRWRSARTAGGQARAAAEVAGLYRRAVARLAKAPVTPLERDGHARIRRAFSASAAVYAGLFRAARHHQRRAYRRARATAQRRDAQARRAVAALGALGYRMT